MMKKSSVLRKVKGLLVSLVFLLAVGEDGLRNGILAMLLEGVEEDDVPA